MSIMHYEHQQHAAKPLNIVGSRRLEVGSLQSTQKNVFNSSVYCLLPANVSFGYPK
jgi:hypothetical protein